jgi:hypothetical protein
MEASKLIGASMAPSTTIMYDNAVKSFDNFRIHSNLPVTWPPSINQFFQYIGYMSVNGFAPSTVRSYLSGISFSLRIQGFSDLTDNFIIKKMLAGYYKLNKRCDIRKPIILDILIQLSDALVHICSSKYEVVMFKAAFALTFSAFLRVGEILLNTLDITLDENKGVLHVHVRFSKTDQSGKYTTIIVQEKPLKSLCPLYTLKQYFKIRPVDTNGPVFCHLNGYSVTRYQFHSVLRSAL